MATVNGTPVNFAFTGTGGITITGLSGVLLQSEEITASAEKEDVRNGVGDIVAHAWFDQHYKAVLEWTITGTSLAAAIVNSALSALTPGTIIAITACTSVPELVATNWEVMDGARQFGSNTNAKRISVPLEKRTGITAVAT